MTAMAAVAVLATVAIGFTEAANDNSNSNNIISNSNNSNSTVATVYRHVSPTTAAVSWSVRFNALDTAEGAAWGTWLDGKFTASNFGSLSVQSHPDLDDTDQMYAIGYLEGALTADRIYEEVVNLREVVLVHYGGLPSTDPKDFPELVKWFSDNEQWGRQQVCLRVFACVHVLLPICFMVVVVTA